METSVRSFFDRYEDLFNRALAGHADMDAVTALYTPEFIAASPAGVAGGRNDDRFRHAMAQGYERYRTIGTKEMYIRDIRVSPIDEHHCLAHVAWMATYERKDRPDIAIDFDVHYFVRMLDEGPRVFGWVTGDEQALLKRHGIV